VAETSVCELGGKIVAQLREAESGAAHVVVEARDDLLGIGCENGESEPEVEQVATAAALIEGTQFGGEQLLRLKCRDVGVAAPPGTLDRVMDTFRGWNDWVSTMFISILMRMRPIPPVGWASR
jgi:hypothetical protein